MVLRDVTAVARTVREQRTGRRILKGHPRNASGMFKVAFALDRLGMQLSLVLWAQAGPGLGPAVLVEKKEHGSV